MNVTQGWGSSYLTLKLNTIPNFCGTKEGLNKSKVQKLFVRSYRAGRLNLYTPFSGPYLSGVLFMSFKLGGAYLLYFSYHGCLP